MDALTSSVCFALLISSPGPNQKTSFIIHGYPTIELAKQAKLDAIGSNDSVSRIDRERYEASPQYKIDQEREAEEQKKKQAARIAKGCPASEFEYPQPTRCSPSVSITGISMSAYYPWDARVIPEPCIKQD